MSVTKTYPVAFQGSILGVFDAVILVLVAFDVWSPNEKQLVALHGLLLALIALGTWFAHAHVWPEPHVVEAEQAVAAAVTAKVQVEADAKLGEVVTLANDQRDEAINLLTQLHDAFKPLTGAAPPAPVVAVPRSVHPAQGLVGGRDPLSEGNL